MTLFLFILLNATLFLRPSDLIDDLAALPIYLYMIVICTATAVPSFIRMLGDRRTLKDPTIVCVLGVLTFIFLSNIARFNIYDARTQSIDFSRTLAYYLLMVAAVSTPARFRIFAGWLAFLIAGLTAVAMLHYYGIINVRSIQLIERPTGDESAPGVLQMIATGMYNDPNDFCMILTTGAMLGLAAFFDKRGSSLRFLWIIPTGMFLVSIVLTRSRGGFLGLLAAIMTLLVFRFGWKKAILLGGLTLPALALVVGGRSVEISAVGDANDTAHRRMEFWAAGFSMLVRSPLFGIGVGQFGEAVGMAAHNSFLQASTEMGLIGGACFFGVYYMPLLTLRRLTPPRAEIVDPALRHYRPFLAAMLVGNMMSMFSITRITGTTSYIVAGLATAYLRVITVRPPDAIPQFSPPLAKNLAVAYSLMTCATYILLRIVYR